jgi:UDP-N-acetylglucosamine pyrophosphorylase
MGGNNPAGICAETAFVLVAGGLGERLGYNGIKVAIPTEITTGACFLELYISQILSLQVHNSRAWYTLHSRAVNCFWLRTDCQ